MSWLDRGFLKDFIRLYRSLPELWDIQKEEYRNKSIKQKAYIRLARKLQEVEPKATVEVVKKKINTLRCSYRRELKKIKLSEKSGVRPEDVYVSSLWYFNRLNFLRGLETTHNDGVSNMEEEEDPPTHKVLRTPSRKERKPKEDRNKLLTEESVENLETREKSLNEARALSASWEVLYSNLESKQKLFANRVIVEALYQGALGKLNENSYKALENQHNCPESPYTNCTPSSHSIRSPSSPIPIRISSNSAFKRALQQSRSSHSPISSNESTLSMDNQDA